MITFKSFFIAHSFIYFRMVLLLALKQVDQNGVTSLRRFHTLAECNVYTLSIEIAEIGEIIDGPCKRSLIKLSIVSVF